MAGRLYAAVSSGAQAGLHIFDHDGASSVVEVLALLAGRAVFTVDVSRNGQFLAISSTTTSITDARVHVYELVGGDYVERANIALTTTSLSAGARISDDGKFLVHINTTSTWLVRMWNGSSYVQTTSISLANTEADFSGFREFVIRNSASLAIYGLNEGTGVATIKSTVAMGGTGAGGPKFSKSGIYAAAANTGTVNLAAKAAATFATYATDGGTVSHGTSPARCAVSNDDTYFAYGQGADLQIYKRTGSTYALVADPAVEPTFSATAMVFSEDTNHFFVAESVSPYLWFYSRSGDAFTKVGDIPIGGSAAISDLAYSVLPGQPQYTIGRMIPTLEGAVVNIDGGARIKFTTEDAVVDIDGIFADRMRFTMEAALVDINAVYTVAAETISAGTLSLTDSATTDRISNPVATDSLDLTAPVLAEHITNVLERLTLAGSTAAMLSAHASAVSSLAFNDLVVAVYEVVVTEQLTLTGPTTADRDRIAALVETLVLSGAASSQMSAVSIVAAAIALADDATVAFAADAIEQLSLSDVLISRWSANAAAIADLIGSDSASAFRRVDLLLVETVELEGLLTLQQVLQAVATDNLEFQVYLVVDGELYVGWVMNTKNLANSEYTNFPFNSMARVGNRYYGAGDGGLYLLEGDTDAGDEIQASILTGQLDFGVPQLKRVEFAHLGYTSSGELVMKVITTQDGERKERWYKAKTTVAGDDREGRFKLGKGVKSKYWQFEWVNVDGADFAIDQVTFTGVVRLARGV